MIERFVRNPLLLGVAFLASAFLGAGIFAAAQAVVPGGLVDADTAKIEKVVRAYLLEHPEVLPEAMEVLQQREDAEREKASTKALAANRAAVLKPFPGAAAGNPDGDVTIVAFMDYACGFCRASLPAIEAVLGSDRGVYMVYREFPVLGETSVTAARWALAAAEQGKFRPFHDALYAGGRLSDASIQAAAKKAGLDIARARSRLNSPEIEAELAKNAKLGRQLGIGGTPAFIVGDRLIPGAVDTAALKGAVADGAGIKPPLLFRPLRRPT